MRQTALQNRFSERTKSEWVYWTDCLVCEKNQWNALHHIISPSVRWYERGKHNESVFNSCPIHNYGCHIGNEPFLHEDENITALLGKVAEALQFLDYSPSKQQKSNDTAFLDIYGDLYSQKHRKMVKYIISGK